MELNAVDQEIFDRFKINLDAIMKAQGMTLAELAQRAGFRNEAELSDILHGPTLPNMAIPVRLSEVLHISVDVLLRDPKENLQEGFEILSVQEIDRQSARLLSAVFNAAERSLDHIGDRPTLDAIISWWKETDGNLSLSDQVAPHFDLVSAAEALTSIPKVHHVGAQGLSATMLGSAESSKLEAFLETLSKSDLAELNKQIRSVAHSGVGMIAPLKRIVPLPGTNDEIEVSFVRLMLPVKDESGTLFILNYSTLLSQTKEISKND